MMTTKKINFRKIDLAKQISIKKGYPLSLSKKIADDLINTFKEILFNGNLKIKDIGNFKLIKKKKRQGRNPKTQEEFEISARKSISFKSSSNLSKFYNLKL